MPGKVTVIAYHREERALREALLKVCAPTRAEKGCINDLHVSPDNPGLLVFHENWVREEDLDAHLASPHIDAFRAVAPDLSEPANITLWSEIED